MAAEVLRRDVLRKIGSSLICGAAIASFGTSAASADPVCADPKKLDSDATTLRAKLNYHEASQDPLRPCAHCAFFHAGAGICGTCQVLQGPTNSKGHCDFWLKAYTPLQ